MYLIHEFFMKAFVNKRKEIPEIISNSQWLSFLRSSIHASLPYSISFHPRNHSAQTLPHSDILSTHPCRTPCSRISITERAWRDVTMQYTACSVIRVFWDRRADCNLLTAKLQYFQSARVHAARSRSVT